MEIKMIDVEKYYDNTANLMPSYTVKKFIELNVKPENAVELGCGAGRERRLYCTPQ